ncbi:MAG TPA: hypothetical protein VGQ13_08545 [Nitrososphaera sp.]|nr:hypothetical protein [Nitrososphaera sp.]
MVACIVSSEEKTHVNNDAILARAQLVELLCKKEKCTIEQIRFFPVELKSDDDTLDERLPNQIIDAILTFGMSVVVLDKNHSKKAKTLGKFLPANIVCYTGREDYFEVSSTFDRHIEAGVFSFRKTTLARLLGDTSARTFNRLITLQRVLEKIAFNQLYLDTLGLTEEELEFLEELAGMPLPSDGRKRLRRFMKETSNTRLTDYC